MLDITTLEERLTVEEALRLKPYIDTKGKVTIGVGRNLTDNGIRKSESDVLLRNDCTEVFQDLDKIMSWWRALSDNRQLVLADMRFNLGMTRLLGFKRTLAFLKAGDYENTAREMLDSEWAREVKSRADKLALLMREG